MNQAVDRGQGSLRGRRPRIGLLVPSSNTTMEPDFYAHLPAGVTLHTARMMLEDVTVPAEEAMLDVHFPQALKELATARPDVVVFGCTSAGALRGNAYDAEICRRIEDAAGCPAVSVIASVRSALLATATGAGRAPRVLVLTPYIEEVNARIQASLEADGIEVAGISGLGIVDNQEIGAVTPAEVAEFAERELARYRDGGGGVLDALFLSCTNFRAMEAREALQERLGLPVVTSNQAAFDAALAALQGGVVDGLRGTGTA